MPPKRPIGGSGNAGVGKAPEHGVEMETEVAVTAGELSMHPDVIDGVELPQPEAESHYSILMVRPSGRTPHPRYAHTILSLRLHPRRHSQSSKPSVYEDATEAPHRR